LLHFFQNRNLSSILTIKPANRCPKLAGVEDQAISRRSRFEGDRIMTNAKLVERNPVAHAGSFDIKLLLSYGVVSALLLIVIYLYSNPSAADFSYLTSNMPLP
jgi:hypothetical protein